jgi:hypothetical protein
MHSEQLYKLKRDMASNAHQERIQGHMGANRLLNPRQPYQCPNPGNNSRETIDEIQSRDGHEKPSELERLATVSMDKIAIDCKVDATRHEV